MKKRDLVYAELDSIKCIALVDSFDFTTFTTTKAIANMGEGWADFHTLFPGQESWIEKRKYVIRKVNEDEVEIFLQFYDL